MKMPSPNQPDASPPTAWALDDAASVIDVQAGRRASTPELAWWIAQTSLVALVLLCLAWEGLIAPLRPGGSWLILKGLPLLVLAPGVLRRRIQPLQWALLLISLYIGEGAVRLIEGMPASLCAAAEMALGTGFFGSAVVILRPLKLAAKRRKAELASVRGQSGLSNH